VGTSSGDLYTDISSKFMMCPKRTATQGNSLGSTRTSSRMLSAAYLENVVRISLLHRVSIK